MITIMVFIIDRKRKCGKMNEFVRYRFANYLMQTRTPTKIEHKTISTQSQCHDQGQLSLMHVNCEAMSHKQLRAAPGYRKEMFNDNIMLSNGNYVLTDQKKSIKKHCVN